MLMQIIGHRGAAGLAPQNSLASIQAAIKAGVDGIEFDIRTTADNQLILSHDDSLKRTHDIDTKISDSTLDDLRQVIENKGQTIATLDDVLKINHSPGWFIEGKGDGWARPLAEKLKDSPNNTLTHVISFNHRELSTFSKLKPQISCYALSYSPIFALFSATKYDFEGIDLFFLALNPVAYWLAKRRNLKIIVFTINKLWLARIFYKLYPDITLTTNTPQLMQSLRAKKDKSAT